MILSLLFAFLSCTLTTDAPGWSKEVVVKHGRTPIVRFQARIEGDYLVVKASHEAGWHTYAMDNELRAAEALQGKKSLGIEQGLEIQVERGLELEHGWRQTAPKDLSQPEIRWYTYGFEQTALFACRLKRTAAQQARLRIRGQACSGETCRQIDITVEFETEHSSNAGPAAVERIESALKTLVPVKTQSELARP